MRTTASAEPALPIKFIHNKGLPLAPIGMGPGGWAEETCLRLALHALKEVTNHGGEIGLLRDLYPREGV